MIMRVEKSPHIIAGDDDQHRLFHAQTNTHKFIPFAPC